MHITFVIIDTGFPSSDTRPRICGSRHGSSHWHWGRRWQYGGSGHPWTCQVAYVRHDEVLRPGLIRSSGIAPSAASKRREVTKAFRHAWDGYSRYCMGHDQMHPVSNTCDDEFGGWGVTAIDALSTAIIMGKKDVVEEILVFISELDMSVVKDGPRIQLFEVAIRHLAGMISAHDLLEGPFSNMVTNVALRRALYRQMVRLGTGLSCAFNTPSGVPRNWVDPNNCRTDSATSNTVAGVGSLILEFTRLSDITGDDSYHKLAKRAEEYLLRPFPEKGEPFSGLLGSFVSIDNGAMLDGKGSWGGLSDSFYEYLLKAYLYHSGVFPAYLERWKTAADSTIRYASSHAYGHPEWTLLPFWEGNRFYTGMDSLSWFAGGNFILGGMVTQNDTLLNFGLSIADTAGAIYSRTATGLGGEFLWWTTKCSPDWGEKKCTAENSVRFSTTSFRLRPEALETWYYAYRATKDPKYRRWAWKMFRAIERYCKTPTGYSSISDVNAPNGGNKTDVQESFVFAEVFKYMYLIFEDVSMLQSIGEVGSVNEADAGIPG
nr:putative mannosyl-oligosaccharide alpha-1,2-mannosidase 1b [Quercus suber]